jgi:hypothetical protein
MRPRSFQEASDKPGRRAFFGTKKAAAAPGGPDWQRRLPVEPQEPLNALRSGRYTAAAIANRKEVAALVREMRALAGTVDTSD